MFTCVNCNQCIRISGAYTHISVHTFKQCLKSTPSLYLQCRLGCLHCKNKKFMIAFPCVHIVYVCVLGCEYVYVFKYVCMCLCEYVCIGAQM